jgi:hypothetical protein
MEWLSALFGPPPPEDEDLEQGLAPSPAEEAEAFVSDCEAWVERHTGAKPRRARDLLVGMAPSGAYWWAPPAHPLVAALRLHYQETQALPAEDIVSTRRYGAMLVYTDEVMQEGARLAAQRFRASGREMEDG